MIGDELDFWRAKFSPIQGVNVGVPAIFQNKIKKQQLNWIAKQRIHQSPTSGNPRTTSKHFRFWYLFLVILAITACNSQKDSTAETCSVSELAGQKGR